jgi:superfamily I DNA/RNA helicase
LSSRTSEGPRGDIRIFDVQHVKGLEFEAVFFIGLENLAIHKPDLFDRYLYVGATRAASFLGLAVAGDHLPEGIRALELDLLARWPART